MSRLSHRLKTVTAELREAGTLKLLRHLETPTGPTTTIEGIGEVLVFCSNNYLGLANHPEVVEAGVDGLRTYGAGTASVRFICGTFTCHRALEERLAHFLGTEAALTYVSYWNANEGLLPALVNDDDAILSDELNHASIIDAARLARNARRAVYAHSNMESLEAALTEVQDAAVTIVVSDGVFSMEGDVARLSEMRTLCQRFGATLVVDDSHGVGVLGAHGRGTCEHLGVPSRGPDGVQILTGTLGKALGGAAGGYVAGPREVIDYLVQRSRPQLFSNALPPTVACSAGKALEILEREPDRVARLHANCGKMRDGLRSLGYEVLDSPTAILPIMIGDTAEAIRASDRLLEMGLMVIAFGFPVVPEGKARLRVQMSAAHTDQHIDTALAAFQAIKD
jgi:glycine C-acetyltransferase